MSSSASFTVLAKPKIGASTATKRRPGANAVVLALGAQDAEPMPRAADTPLGFFAIRQELIHGLRSTGGRPALAGAERRKIPVTEPVWRVVSEAAEAMAKPGFHPTPSQVAGALLALAVRHMAPGAAREVEHALKASGVFVRPRTSSEALAFPASDESPPLAVVE